MTVPGVDPLFPFPEPTFLFVHELTYHATTSSPVVDDTGWYDADAVVASSEQNVPCYVGNYDPSDVSAGDTKETTISAVALVSRDRACRPEDEVTVTKGLSHLLGRYRIDQVRPNPSHTRLLLTRVPARETE